MWIKEGESIKPANFNSLLSIQNAHPSVIIFPKLEEFFDKKNIVNDKILFQKKYRIHSSLFNLKKLSPHVPV